MPSTVRVVVADDHPLVRAGLRAVLDVQDGVSVVGEAADGAAAIEAAARLRPDVVVMDLDMPGTGGVEATRRIVAIDPAIGVLVVSMLGDEQSVMAALRAGARGYLVKGAEAHAIVRAVRAVAAGEAILGTEVAAGIVGRLSAPPRGPVLPVLTSREREVLVLMAAGMGNHAIARRLVISDKTVSNHVSAVYAKLGVANRAAAVARARQEGLAG